MDISPRVIFLGLLLSLFAVVLPLIAPPSAAAPMLQPAASGGAMAPFGMNTYFTGLERNGRDGDAGVSTLVARGRQVGAVWAREELSWGNLERDGKGRWTWAAFDRRLLEASRAGYQVVGMLLTTPAWARVADCPQRMVRYAFAGVRALDYWCPPANPRDFADYVAAVVERYDGDGATDAPGSPRVAAWQIWNEPNAWETWPGTPAEYGAILQAGYAAAKAADPSAIVATGGLYVFDGSWNDGIGHRDGLNFLSDALAARPAAWASFDALAIHPYMPTVAPDEPGVYGAVTLWGRLALARAWLDERTATLGGRSRPIWISEVGWSTCTAEERDCNVGPALASADDARVDDTAWRLTLGPSAAQVYAEEAASDAQLLLEAPPVGRRKEELAALIGKSEQQQANYLVRTYGIALALGVQHISWFQLEDKFDGSARNFWEEAAIFRSVAQGYAPKPAAVAYSTMVQQLGDARFMGFGPLHSYRHVPTTGAPEARFHLRFVTSDNTLVDLIWRNTGVEELAIPLESGASVAVIGRDGQAIPSQPAGGLLRLPLGEAPVYLRQTLPPALAVSPGEVTVYARPGSGPREVRLSLRNLGSGPIGWAAAVDAHWARVTPASSQAQYSELRMALDPTGMAEGVYGATLRFSGSWGTRDVPVRLVVTSRLTTLIFPVVYR